MHNNMDFLAQLRERGVSIMKMVGAIVVGLLLLGIVVTSLNSSRNNLGMNMSPHTSEMYESKGGILGAPTLSFRNSLDTSTPEIEDSYTPGNDAEAFEVKEYTAQIETRNIQRDCDVVHGLKGRTDVIFEQANSYDRGCSFTFKVEKEHVSEILDIVKAMHPRDLSESTYTIKHEVDDFTSEITILENKLASLDKTLSDAVLSYENITALASDRGDVESLAKIIESKLVIIERLTNARIETGNALERASRAKNEALDRLAYTYFSVNVYENTFVDVDSMKDSWKSAVQQFVFQANTLVQEMSIGVVYLIFTILKLAFYFVILLFATRFAWTFAKKVWKGEDRV